MSPHHLDHAQAVRKLPSEQDLGFHFHWPCNQVGHETWFRALDAALAWGRALEDLAERPVRCFDIGGGWFPDDFESVLIPRIPELVAGARSRLRWLDVLILEPGKALCQPHGFVETSVLEARYGGDRREVVVDASTAELPEADAYPHRLLSGGPDKWRRWGAGPDRVLGRLCVETDILATGVGIPAGLRAGDRILIADAGAYDRSTSYDFGLG